MQQQIGQFKRGEMPTRIDRDDWHFVGRWLGNRAVINEIGYPVFNDPDTIWIGWTDVPGIGFVTFKRGTAYGQIDALYVHRDYRKTGLGRALVSAAIEEIGRPIRVSANGNSRHLFLTFGFEEISRSKNFTKMELM